MSCDEPTTRSGVAITEQLAAQLADEAEVGYDLDQGEVVQVGRSCPPQPPRGC